MPVINNASNTENLNGTKSSFRSRSTPLYVRHAYPHVDSTLNGKERSKQSWTAHGLSERNDAATNYGMLYNEPHTEAEKGMHALFIAKRQQEVSSDQVTA